MTDRATRAKEYRAELADRLRAATTPEERRAIRHEAGRVGAQLRRWRNRAAKGDLSPERTRLREAVAALEAFDAHAARCVCGHGIILHAGGTVEQRAALVAAMNAARLAVKGTP